MWSGSTSSGPISPGFEGQTRRSARLPGDVESLVLLSGATAREAFGVNRNQMVSGAHESVDGVGGFLDLGDGRFLIALLCGVEHAVLEVVIEQAESDVLQC